MQPKHGASIFTCARQATPYVSEWLQYHRAIGFDQVYLYCNDDDPLELYGEVRPFCEGPRPFVTFRHFPYRGQQFYMLLHGLRHYRQETEWIAFLDIDEFLVLPHLDNVKAFLGHVPPGWAALHINWSFFGNNFHAERPHGSVLLNYTRREEQLHPGGKTITRSARIDLDRLTDKFPFWLGWQGRMGPEFQVRDVLGHPVEAVPTWSSQIQEHMRNTAVIARYAFRSTTDFIRRLHQGAQDEFAGLPGWQQIHEAQRPDALLSTLNAITDTYLADFWQRCLRDCQAARVVPPARLPNVAPGKPANQSSIGAASRGATTEADAAGVVSGRITGGAQCHTAEEDQPWWMVDLGEPHLIYEIRLFNRVDQPAMRHRLGAFRIELGADAGSWQPIYENDGSVPVGGADGDPLILRLSTAATARGVRVRALGHTCLHLDQVEVYGVKLQ